MAQTDAEKAAAAEEKARLDEQEKAGRAAADAAEEARLAEEARVKAEEEAFQAQMEADEARLEAERNATPSMETHPVAGLAVPATADAGDPIEFQRNIAREAQKSAPKREAPKNVQPMPYEQFQAESFAAAHREAMINRLDQTVPGGRYEIAGQIVDANGVPVK